jgi:hypothetical protein
MDYFDAALRLVWGLGMLIIIAGFTMPIIVYDGVSSRRGTLRDRAFIFIIGYIIMGFGMSPF